MYNQSTIRWGPQNIGMALLRIRKGAPVSKGAGGIEGGR